MKCECCGGDKYLRRSLWLPAKGTIICSPCFAIWYDGPAAPPEFDRNNRTHIGALSIFCKVLGAYPWDKESIEQYEKGEQKEYIVGGGSSKR